VRALLPQVETVLGPDARQIRDAVSRLQMEYARLAGAGAASAAPEGDEKAAEPEPQSAEQPPNPDDPGPAQSSGRLWVPGR
jgi:hypothetical protein